MAYVDQRDLESAAGVAEVARLFDDNGDGVVDPDLVAGPSEGASALLDTYLLEGWTQEAIRDLVADPLLRRHVAWVAIHFRAQSKPEWRDQNGIAPYRTEYKDALDHFDRLSKGRARSRKEATAGDNQMTRGQVSRGCPPFVIAASRNDPRGPGGF
jgi:hypothetical protein